jgi:hypothetical protein
LVAKAFFFSGKLHFWKLSPVYPPSAAKVLKNFSNLYVTILLFETQAGRDLEKAQVLWINGRNYSAFTVAIDFDEIFEHINSFHWHFHMFFTKIS